jgi:hypothetical protein
VPIPKTQLNCSAPKLVFWQAGVSKPNSGLSTTVLYCLTLPYNHFFTDHAENTAYIFEACLLRRCLAVDVLSSRVLVPVGMCLPSLCLARGIHVTFPLKSRAGEKMNRRSTLPYIPYKCHLALARSATARN